MYKCDLSHYGRETSSELKCVAQLQTSDPQFQAALRSLPLEQRQAFLKSAEKDPTASPQGYEALKKIAQDTDAPEEVLQRLAALRNPKPPSNGFEPSGAKTVFQPPLISTLNGTTSLHRVNGTTNGHKIHDAPSDDSDTSRLAASMKTATSEFNEVLALSQGLINASFKFLYQLKPSLHTIEVRTDFGSLVSNLKAPQVSLTVVNPGPPLYYLNFGEEGTFTFIKKGVTTEVPTKNWVFVFAVNLAMAGIDPKSPEGKKISEQIDNPGDYSISQLLTDFQTANITNPMLSLCNFNGYEFPPGAFLYFRTFIMEWLENGDVTSSGALGYSWTTQNPHHAYSNAPSFPPTQQIFQCYPHYAPGQKEPVEGLGAGDNNMLLYLEMTELRPVPVERSLLYTGNWTTPSIPASMAIGSQVFWSDFLFGNSRRGLLNQMNRDTWIDALSTKAEYGVFTCYFTWRPGKGNHEDPFFTWVPKSDGTGWSWHQSSSSAHKDYSSPGCFARAGLQTHTANDITVVPGTNRIKISGVTKINLQYEIEQVWIEQGGSAESKNTWSFTIDAMSILEGGLKLNVNLPAEDSDLFKITSSTSTSWSQPAKAMDGIVADMNKWTRAVDVRNAAKRLHSSLNGTAKFFLPGAGDFFYKDPIYSKEHNLLVSATFNGMSDWLGRKPQPLKRIPTVVNGHNGTTD